jgi:colanic acid/amylovoran biosynthesis glycosyltransferase
MTVGYIAQMFPSLTMTFVYREVRALRAAGLQIQTFSTWRPNLDQLSEEAKDMVEGTFYIFPLDWPRFLLSHAWYLITRPRRYVGTLWLLLTREYKTFRNRLRTFYHFCEAVYLAREVERRGIAHMHVHFALNATTVAMVVNRLTDIPFSFTAHANDIFVNPILLPEKIKAARFIVTISEYNRQFLHDIVPGRETLDKIHLVRYGVDTQAFSPPARRPDNDRPIILDVARLVEKKGHPYLVKACKILAGQGYDFQCLIVGDGPQGSLLQQMIEEDGLSDRVNLVGVVFQENLKNYLNRADIFALPCIVASDQDRDGLPNTLIESMAMGIPTISTTVSGIPELIAHMETGLLVPPRDEVSLAQAIATLLEDKELRAVLGKGGRSKVVEEFEIEKNAERLFRIFETYLLDRSHP